MTTSGTDVPERPRQPVPITAGRSRNLAAIRRANTKPEVELRSVLHRRGRRFRKDFRLDLQDARVRPDLVFTKSKLAVFVDGCFWHVCPTHGREPTHNEWYWTPKLRRNVERDRKADAALAAAGWHVLRIWEHVPVEQAASLVERALGSLTTTHIEHVFDSTTSREDEMPRSAEPDGARQ